MLRLFLKVGESCKAACNPIGRTSDSLLRSLFEQELGVACLKETRRGPAGRGERPHARDAHIPLRALIRRAWEANSAVLGTVRGVTNSCAAAGPGDGGNQFAEGSGNPVEHSPLEPSGYSVRFHFQKLPVGNLGQPSVPAASVVRRVVENVGTVRVPDGPQE